jgi:predicted acetyltransferase
MAQLELVVPSRRYLDEYVDALRSGWSPDNMRPHAYRELLEQVENDADAFLASLVDREATGTTFTLPDGSVVPRLPGYQLWIWDGHFCGTIGFRFQPGTAALPPYVLGHIGYAVVPWKRGHGYGKRALALMLERAHAEGLPFVHITTDPDNIPSQRVIEANGGVLVERFVRGPQYGCTQALRYRIDLPAGRPASMPAV